MTSKKPKIQTQIIGKDGINPIFLLAVIIVLSVTIRLYYFPTDIPITFDGIDYFSYAMKISQSGDFPNTIFPNNGWPSFVSLFFSFFLFIQFRKFFGLYEFAKNDKCNFFCHDNNSCIFILYQIF